MMTFFTGLRSRVLLSVYVSRTPHRSVLAHSCHTYIYHEHSVRYARSVRCLSFMEVGVAWEWRTASRLKETVCSCSVWEHGYVDVWRWGIKSVHRGGGYSSMLRHHTGALGYTRTNLVERRVGGRECGVGVLPFVLYAPCPDLDAGWGGTV